MPAPFYKKIWKYSNYSQGGKTKCIESYLKCLFINLGNSNNIYDFVNYQNNHFTTGQIVTCANGIDFSAMSVTYSLIDHLMTNYNLNQPHSSHLLRSLRQGVLLNRAGKNRSHNHFVLNEHMHPDYIP